jgi:hypothetical protein
MAEHIQTVTDKNQFEKICGQYFQNNEVYIKTKNGDLEIKYFGYSDGRVAFKIPYLKNMADSCLLIARNGDNTLHANVKYAEKQEDDMFIFRILNFQVITLVRSEERKSLENKTGTGKVIVFVTNVISDFIIQNTLALHEKRVDDLKEGIIAEFGKTFKFIKIFFSNEGSSDARMKHFQKTRQLVYVPDFKKKELENDEKVKFFINNIYAKDYYLQNRKEFISEISIPILYKMKLPYGYIQINNNEPLNEPTLNIIKKVAVRIDETLTKEKFFPRAGDKMIVSNVTMNGFGIVFKDRIYIRYFKVNSYVNLDMLLPDNKKASILANVRNISILDNKVIKIGFQIDEIDALSEVHYQEFVDALNASR